MKTIIQFLARLSRHNEREWFQAHKAEYQEAQAKFNNFTDQLIKGLAQFDPTVGNLTAKDCTYRIYRDTRFSNDKSPYKTHMGAFVCPHGKKSGYSGYYFQVGPEDSGYPSGCMLATGNYCFEPRVLRILREDIAAGGGDFEETLRQAAPLFRLDESDRLKRVPRGFPADAPYSPLLAYRSYCLVYEPGQQFMLQDDVLAQTLAAFRRTQPFLAYLNRAVAFALDPAETDAPPVTIL